MSNPESYTLKSASINSIDPQTKTALLARRAVYCAAMDIDVWMARKPLQGVGSHQYLPTARPALASEELPPGTDVEKPENRPQQISVDASSARQALKKSLQDTQSSVAEPAPSKSVPSESAVDRQQGAKLEASVLGKFELCACSIGDVFILDDVSQAQFAPSVYQNWMAALSLALGKTNAGTASHLRWPDALTGIGAPVPMGQQKGLAAAREVTQAWMLRQLSAAPAHILLMGDIPNRLIDDEELASMRKQYPQMAGVAVIRTIASAQAWQSAEYKRQIWAQIAPLSH